MSLHPRRATRAEQQDLRLLEETGYLGATMPGYMSWRMQEEWREQADAKPIRLDSTLNIALNKTHWQIVDAVCHALGISSKGRRQDKARTITDHLTEPKNLRAVVGDLPLEMRLVLKRTLDAGGWIRFKELTREFGEQEGDGWFWNEHPPKSLIGGLRTHGLVFVGTAKVGKGKIAVAVIPTDLRETLTQTLGDYASELEPLGDLNLPRALGALAQHYPKPEYPPVIPRKWFEEYIRSVAERNGDAFAVWENLEHFDYFLSSSLIRGLTEITPRQLSVWVTEFLPRKYIGDFPLADRRAMVKTVAEFYAWLARQGRVEPSLAEQIGQGAQKLLAQKGAIEPEDLPPPLGGEVVVEGRRGKQREQFTYNDRWLALVCLVKFDGDFNQIYRAAAQVADGAVKQQLIRRIASFDQKLWQALTQNATQDEADFAWEWFNNAPVMTASAW